MRLLLIGIALALSAASAEAQVRTPFAPYVGQLRSDEQRWFAELFQRYRAAFMTADGRVIDLQNGGVSHSESQGYGMMLALLGNDRATFDATWRFTKANMQRPDKLFGWKFVPGRGVIDWNNATDGDILIAAALALGGSRWTDDAYLAEATAIADSAGDQLIERKGDRLLLLPGVWAKPHGNEPVVVNFSYYVPMALVIMQALTLHHPWNEVLVDGRELLDTMGSAPSDWSQVDDDGRAVPADSRSPTFSYDAVRIPLYQLQAGMGSGPVARSLLGVWGVPGARAPYSFNVWTHEPSAPLSEASYRFTHQLLYCAEAGAPVALETFAMPTTNYYASSLHLMGLAALYASYPDCFPVAEALGPRW